MIFENKPEIGWGIFTIPDLARILNLKYHKVQKVLNEYWDTRFAAQLGSKYSWTDGKSRAVTFHTLVEFYIYYRFKEAGANTKDILKAHQELSERFDTPFPFASSQIINKVGTFGKKIVISLDPEHIMDLNNTRQLKLHFIKSFITKLDFDGNDLASRFWPLGKEKSVVVDPHHQFGQPTIAGSNILTATVFNMYLAKEPVPFIASTFGLNDKSVADAIDFCKNAA